MKIGLDFDNTIVCYDQLFYDIALEKGYISPQDRIAVNKNAVRNALRAKAMEDEWTLMQGYGYGVKIKDAVAFDGAVKIIQALIKQGAELFIISHKTHFSVKGEPYDLHKAAHEWIKANIVDEKGKQLLPFDHIYFNQTKEGKLKVIDHCACDYFLDDLPEILNDPMFPKSTKAILFAPDQSQTCESNSYDQVRHWSEFYERINRI